MGTALIILIWLLFVNIGLPLWAAIVLTIVGAVIAIVGLLFTVYFFNIDSKALVLVHKFLQRFYDKRKRDRHL